MKTIKMILLATCLLVSAGSAKAVEPWLTNYKKVLVIGAHPDDPETISGGTMLKLKALGAEVVTVYFTSGEAGIQGKTQEEASFDIF